MNILAILPARGGSKGIFKKNIKIINGKPLVSYTIETALKSDYITKIALSTDDEDIKKISSKYNINVMKRPENLAADNSPTIETIVHTLDSYENEGFIPDIVVLLQPTSPLRTSEDIDNSIKIFVDNECDSVVSVCEYEHSPCWLLKMDEIYLKPAFGKKYLKMRRQVLPKFYIPNGAIFISTPEHLRNYKSFYEGIVLPYLMPTERSIDIDNIIDFRLAELIMQGGFSEENQNREQSNK